MFYVTPNPYPRSVTLFFKTFPFILYFHTFFSFYFISFIVKNDPPYSEMCFCANVTFRVKVILRAYLILCDKSIRFLEIIYVKQKFILYF